jgi:hypothetical protein
MSSWREDTGPLWPYNTRRRPSLLARFLRWLRG